MGVQSIDLPKNMVCFIDDSNWSFDKDDVKSINIWIIEKKSEMRLIVVHFFQYQVNIVSFFLDN